MIEIALLRLPGLPEPLLHPSNLLLNMLHQLTQLRISRLPSDANTPLANRTTVLAHEEVLLQLIRLLRARFSGRRPSSLSRRVDPMVWTAESTVRSPDAPK